MRWGERNCYWEQKTKWWYKKRENKRSKTKTTRTPEGGREGGRKWEYRRWGTSGKSEEWGTGVGGRGWSVWEAIRYWAVSTVACRHSEWEGGGGREWNIMHRYADGIGAGRAGDFNELLLFLSLLSWELRQSKVNEYLAVLTPFYDITCALQNYLSPNSPYCCSDNFVGPRRYCSTTNQ